MAEHAKSGLTHLATALYRTTPIQRTQWVLQQIFTIIVVKCVCHRPAYCLKLPNALALYAKYIRVDIHTCLLYLQMVPQKPVEEDQSAAALAIRNSSCDQGSR